MGVQCFFSGGGGVRECYYELCGCPVLSHMLLDWDCVQVHAVCVRSLVASVLQQLACAALASCIIMGCG
jgi:hypothetical protein